MQSLPRLSEDFRGDLNAELQSTCQDRAWHIIKFSLGTGQVELEFPKINWLITELVTLSSHYIALFLTINHFLLLIHNVTCYLSAILYYFKIKCVKSFLVIY